MRIHKKQPAEIPKFPENLWTGYASMASIGIDGHSRRGVKAFALLADATRRKPAGRRQDLEQFLAMKHGQKPPAHGGIYLLYSHIYIYIYILSYIHTGGFNRNTSLSSWDFRCHFFDFWRVINFCEFVRLCEALAR